jgi:hypothetical protein
MDPHQEEDSVFICRPGQGCEAAASRDRLQFANGPGYSRRANSGTAKRKNPAVSGGAFVLFARTGQALFIRREWHECHARSANKF